MHVALGSVVIVIADGALGGTVKRVGCWNWAASRGDAAASKMLTRVLSCKGDSSEKLWGEAVSLASLGSEVSAKIVSDHEPGESVKC